MLQSFQADMRNVSTSRRALLLESVVQVRQIAQSLAKGAGFPRFMLTLRGGLEKVLYVCPIPRSGHLSMLIFLVSGFAWS